MHVAAAQCVVSPARRKSEAPLPAKDSDHFSDVFLFGTVASMFFNSTIKSDEYLMLPDVVCDLLQQWMTEDDDGWQAAVTPSAETILKATRSFLKSLLRKTGSSSQVLLTAAVYLNRVRASGAYGLTRASFCILTTVCLYLASKFLHDNVYTVKLWAASSGFAAGDILAAEREVLQAVQFELFASSDDLVQLMLRSGAERSTPIQSAINDR